LQNRLVLRTRLADTEQVLSGRIQVTNQKAAIGDDDTRTEIVEYKFRSGRFIARSFSVVW